MDIQASPMEKSMMGYVITKEGVSSSIVDALAVSCLCWHMKQSMLQCHLFQKSMLIPQVSLSLKFTISFPKSSLPDMGEEVPWYEDEEDE